MPSREVYNVDSSPPLGSISYVFCCNLEFLYILTWRMLSIHHLWCLLCRCVHIHVLYFNIWNCLCKLLPTFLLFMWFIGGKWDYEHRNNWSAGKSDGAALAWKQYTNSGWFFRKPETSRVYKSEVLDAAGVKMHFLTLTYSMFCLFWTRWGRVQLVLEIGNGS